MNISKLKVIIILMLLIVFAASAFARTYDEAVADKKLDMSQVHELGNIWLRVSNYGFFGSGGEGWPSLEYPGGSSICLCTARNCSAGVCHRIPER
jgi:hypothetical protein